VLKLITHQPNIVCTYEKKKILLLVATTHTLFTAELQDCYIPFSNFFQDQGFFLGFPGVIHAFSGTESWIKFPIKIQNKID